MSLITLNFYPAEYAVSPKMAEAYNKALLEKIPQSHLYTLDTILGNIPPYPISRPTSSDNDDWEYFDQLLDQHGGLTLDCLEAMLKEIVS